MAEAAEEFGYPVFPVKIMKVLSHDLVEETKIYDAVQEALGNKEFLDISINYLAESTQGRECRAFIQFYGLTSEEFQKVVSGDGTRESKKRLQNALSTIISGEIQIEAVNERNQRCNNCSFSPRPVESGRRKEKGKRKRSHEKDEGNTEENAKRKRGNQENTPTRDQSSHINKSDTNKGKIQADSPQQNRGPHHVINKGVLREFKNMLEDFLKSPNVNHSFNDKVKNFIKSVNDQAIPANVKEVITNDLCVSFPRDKPDQNSTSYGKDVEALRKTILSYMKTFHQTVSENPIEKEVRKFLDNESFVDKEAYHKWLKEGGDPKKFENAKDEVIKMFQKLYINDNEMVHKWMKDISNIQHDHADFSGNSSYIN